jgi:hypothetical protein
VIDGRQSRRNGIGDLEGEPRAERVFAGIDGEVGTGPGDADHVAPMEGCGWVAQVTSATREHPASFDPKSLCL